MRTTVEFDDDTAQAIEAFRHERRAGLSQAVNELIRRGLVAQPARPPFRQRTAPLGVSIDTSSIADALELLEGAATR